MELWEALAIMRHLEKSANQGQTFSVQTQDGKHFSVQVTERSQVAWVMESLFEAKGFVIHQVLTRPMR